MRGDTMLPPDAGTCARAPAVELLGARPLTPLVGSEVGGAVDLSRAVEAPTVAAISAALEQRKVLVFRGQHRMGTEDQLRLVRALNACWDMEASSAQQAYNYMDGAFQIRMLPSKQGHSNIWRVESSSARALGSGSAQPANPAEASTAARAGNASVSRSARDVQPWPFTSALRRASPEFVGNGRFHHVFGGTGAWSRPGHEETNATNVWHSDDNYVLEPPWITTLRAVQVPSVGGDTLFADMGAAFASLAPASQELLCGLTIETDFQSVFPHYQGRGSATAELRRRYPRVLHPMVRTHPTTGDRVLFANAIYTRRVHGLPDDGVDDPYGENLLREIFSLPGVPEFQCRLRWAAGDFVLWDNRALQH